MSTKIPSGLLATSDVGDDEPKLSESRIVVASQWQLMWWRFRKHRVAVVCTVIVALFYFEALFCEFFAPAVPGTIHGSYKYVPPMGISFINQNGQLTWHPGVYGLISHEDKKTFQFIYTPNPKVWHPIYFFTPGPPYKLWGLIPSDIHFFGLGPSAGDAPFYLLGSDRLGHDFLTRLLYGARVSLSIGLVGVTFSLFFGIILGGISGYYGGTVDQIIQRTIEFIRSLPSIPLWMALSAAFPPQWPPQQVYFAITLILSLIGWTTLARVVRGRFLSLREEDFVLAARLSGSSQMRIIWRHMVPSFLSHIIAVITLSIPSMILSETALSFLGLGLRSPVVSWGVLLEDAQNVQTISAYPWLLLPAVAVVIVVLSFNFMGDGLRDAADPYGGR